MEVLMKAMMALLLLTFSLGAQAQSRMQTRHCGDTLRQVSNIINQKFLNLNAGAVVACFRGNWGYGIVIDLDKKLNLGGYDFEACPQASGAIYLHKKNTPSDGGLLICRNGRMRASGFQGSMSVANGNYSRQGTSVATGTSGNN